MTQEICSNCGGPIGKLEAAYVFQDQPVCESCYSRLAKPQRATRPLWPRPIVGIGVAAVLIVVVVAILFFRGRVSGGTWSNTGSIAGFMWVSRNNGTSDIQRGVEIAVLRPTTSREPVVASINAGLTFWKKELQHRNEASAVIGKRPSNYWTNEDIARVQKRIDDIPRTIAQFPDRPGVLQAHKILWSSLHAGDIETKRELAFSQIQTLQARLSAEAAKATANLDAIGSMQLRSAEEYLDLDKKALPTWFNADFTPDFAGVAAVSAVARCRTGSDGNYAITGVEPGDYVVYAAINTPVICVEWLVPVRLKAGEAQSCSARHLQAKEKRRIRRMLGCARLHCGT